MIRRAFLSGLWMILPVCLTVAVVLIALNLLSIPFALSIRELLTPLLDCRSLPLWVVELLSRLLALVALLVLIVGVGMLGERFLFRTLLAKVERLLLRPPGLRTVYTVAKEITLHCLGSGKRDVKPFKKVLLAPFPSASSCALGLNSSSPVPQEIARKLKAHLGTEVTPLFIPTSPQPVSGFLLLYQVESVADSSIDFEQLMQFLVSCGVFQAGESCVDG